MIRITFVLRRKPGMTREEFQDYWRTNHGPLVASFANTLDILRYVQVHAVGSAAAPSDGVRGQMEEPYDGVAELWWRSRDALVAASGTPAGQAAGAALLEDERTFIDLPNSPLWVAHEYPQVNPTPENIVAGGRNSIIKLHYPLRAKAGMAEADAQFYWRTNHGPLIRSWAPAMRILRYVQVHRAQGDPLEAALRGPRGTAVDGYMGHAELWFDRGIQGAPTQEAAAAAAAAAEDEAKFIDFARSTIFYGKENVVIDRRQQA
ncbi:MAG: EthD domain-containing protein [Dehalococcoidia bacterium]